MAKTLFVLLVMAGLSLPVIARWLEPTDKEFADALRCVVDRFKNGPLSLVAAIAITGAAMVIGHWLRSLVR